MVWDADNAWEDEPDFRDEREDKWSKHTPRTRTNTRGSVIGVPETRVTKTWNGVPVKDMESSHVINSIMYCEKKFADALSFHLQCFPDAQRSDFYFKTVYEMFPEYLNLRNEWDRRMEKL